MSVKERFTRREGIGYAVAVVTTLFLAGCESAEAKAKVISPGDVAKLRNEAFRLVINNGSKGRYKIPDLPKYLEYIKASEYGVRQIDIQSATALGEFPLKQAPTEPIILDEYTGDQKDSKKEGGEFIFLSGGLYTNDQLPTSSNSNMRPDNMYVALRKALREKGDFGPRDILFNTFGKEYLEMYTLQDTLRDPAENIRLAIEQFEQLMLDFPLAQFNLIGHSLGGRIMFEVARKYPWAVNNLILLSCPVKGIDPFLGRPALQYIKQQYPVIASFFGDEKVSKYFFDLWDKRQEIDDFGESFTKSGKKIMVIYAPGDPIAGKGNAEIKGAENIMLPSKGPSFLGLSFDLNAHGRPLTDPIAINAVERKLGKNLARV